MNRQLSHLVIVLLCLSGHCIAPASLAVAQKSESKKKQSESTKSEQENEQDANNQEVAPEVDPDSLPERVRIMLLDGNIRDAQDLVAETIQKEQANVDAMQVQRSYAMIIAAFSRTRNLREVYKTHAKPSRFPDKSTGTQ